MSWTEWLEANLPKYLDGDGELSPPWVKFPHYERGTIGWRMGDGETWMGLWRHFCDKSDDAEAYLRKHPPAPENWADIIAGVLYPEAEAEVEHYLALREKGLVASDAGYENWLRSKDAQEALFWSDSALGAAQYRTRGFSFWSRAYHHLPTRKEYSIRSAPGSWWDITKSSPSLDEGWACLAADLMQGEAMTPWEIGLEPGEPDYGANDSAEYLDAYAIWLMTTIDDGSQLEKYLKLYAAPEEWRVWCRARAHILF